MTTDQNSKKTPLYDSHVALGAKIIDFAGWLMPLQYTGALDEHNNVRTNCGLFDTSHMGEILVTGEDALDAVQSVITNDISKIEPGRCQYNIICNEDGNALDDVIVYKYSEQKFFFCVNAGNKDKIYKWLTDKIGDKVSVEDQSDSYAMIALQGPTSAEVLKQVTDADVTSMKPFSFMEAEVCGVEVIIATTGYTGEVGFEIFFSLEQTGEQTGEQTEKIGTNVATLIWNTLLDKGAPFGIKPAGLVSRDTLRIEMGYPLYGNELGQDITPIEAGLGKYVKFTKGDFIGKKVLENQATNGTKKLLRGFILEGRGIARSHYGVYYNGKQVGEVTSGTFSPSLKKSVGLAFVTGDLASTGTDASGKTIEIAIRKSKVEALITKAPFYKKPKG